jgi:hypothetical protein
MSQKAIKLDIAGMQKARAMEDQRRKESLDQKNSADSGKNNIVSVS